MSEKPASLTEDTGHVASTEVGLALRDLCKTFGGPAAVDNVNLIVQRGEFLTLLGPSGSGKTTLLLMIAGFVLPTAGDIRLDGRSIVTLAPEKRNFGMVFQGYALFPHMNVRQNIAYPLDVRRWSRNQIDDRVKEMLDLVQLEPFSERLPRQLSGGQQQRVALARALSFGPEILLLDEPLGALDKKLRSEVQLQLKALHRQLGTTFIYVTHDQEEALSMSDRVVIMNHGQTVQIGSPAELYERPTTSFAAGFLGKSNFLHGEVTSVDQQLVRYDVSGQTLVQERQTHSFEPGDSITLALRPEKLEITQTNGSVSASNTIDGAVTDVTYFGSVISIAVRTTTAGDLHVELPAWRSSNTFEIGATVYLSWASDAAMVVYDF